MFATVEGQTVKVGDVVCFKSDYEQCGKITNISTNFMGQKVLTLYSEDGFGGDYLQYANSTTELASDCWIE